jgi:signal-transduction protein with cAMP-binding, CBS, and nucleotidyltransferase domain
MREIVSICKERFVDLNQGSDSAAVYFLLADIQLWRCINTRRRFGRVNFEQRIKAMLATEVMKTSFATVKPDTPLIDAARLLLETNQQGLPVLDRDGRLVGIVTEGDLLHRDELGVSPPLNWIEALLGIEEGGPVRERCRYHDAGSRLRR